MTNYEEMGDGAALETVSNRAPATLPSQTAFAPMNAPVLSAQQSVDLARTLAEVRGQIMLAREFPRNYQEVEQEIRRGCRRPVLAEAAEYALPIGKDKVHGPSIRLLEHIAQCMTNFTYGTREITTEKDEKGIYTACEAFAFDLQRNVRVPASFKVYHHIMVNEYANGRPTGKKIKKEFKDEGEIKRAIAAASSKVLRNCIARCVPGDLIESGREEARKTLAGMEKGVPLSTRISKAVQAFAAFGIKVDEIEAIQGVPCADWTEEILSDWRKTWAGLKSGDVSKEDVLAPLHKDEKVPTGAAADVLGEIKNGRKA